MFVGPVARVDDACVQMLREQMRRCPGERMPDHHHVDAHGLDILGRVNEGLALAQAGARGVKSSVSAPNRRAASEKLVRVRVDASKKQVSACPPSKRRELFLQPPVASLNEQAVSRIRRISSAESSSKPKRCRRVQAAGAMLISPTLVLMSVVSPRCMGGIVPRMLSRQILNTSAGVQANPPAR